MLLPACCSKSYQFQLLKNYTNFHLSVFFLSVLDVFTKGIWRNIDREIPDELGQYQKKLKRLCLAARAPSTVRTYGYAFQKWKNGLYPINYVSFPADPAHVAAFSHVNIGIQGISPFCLDSNVCD